MEVYDYIIVGAGSSGCVLANRLSSDPNVRVLLVEAGPSDNHPYIHMPRAFRQIYKNDKYVWRYQAQKTGGYNEVENWLRGKVLGGSSSVNGMVYVRGQPEDYDDWERSGCTGWGWEQLGRCFREMEDHELGASESRGAGGPLKISLYPGRQPLCEAMMAAAGECGLKRVQDLNEIAGQGIGYQPRTIWRGRRQSSAKAFLHPVRGRSNLTVLTNTEVRRIILEGRRATGIFVRSDRSDRAIQGRRDIILSAGALNTPKLLQLSGIGPGGLLQRFGVPIVRDSPEVGRNLIEHRVLLMQFRVHKDSQNKEFKGGFLILNALRYALFGKGVLTHSAFEVGAYVKSDPALSRPDFQLGMAPISTDKTSNIVQTESFPGALCGGYVMRPKSRGVLEIRGPDPDTPLFIDPNYLSARADQKVSVAIVRFIRKMFSQRALVPWQPQETWPGWTVKNAEEIVDMFHRSGGSGYHASTTCRMGPDANAVVDPELRVRGVEGLRVCDISIMPSLISGNTNGPAMAMAWRAAEIIRS